MLIVSVAAMEGVARLLLPGLTPLFRWSSDSELLFDLRPGGPYESRGLISYDLGPWTANIDARGCRRIAATASCGPTILFLGDSMMFGFGVEDSDAVPAVVAEISGRTIHNCAVPGYNLSQYVRAAELRIPELQPKLVVIGIHPYDLNAPMNYAAPDGDWRLAAFRSRLFLAGYIASMMVFGPTERILTGTEADQLFDRLAHAVGRPSNGDSSSQGVPTLFVETGGSPHHPTFQFEQAAQQRGFPVLVLTPKEDWLLPDHQHWNRHGAQEAAAIMIPALEQMIPADSCTPTPQDSALGKAQR